MTENSEQDLRQILGKFLTGVTVVTTLDKNKVPVGFTANSFTSVSLDPPLVLVCVAQSAGLSAVFRRANAFAINILAAGQDAISNGFAHKDADRYSGVAWSAKTTGSPVLDDCAAWLDCKMHEIILAGDHVMLIGRIVDAEKTTRHPLGYYQGQYCAVDLPEETLSRLEHRESVHASTGILVDNNNQLLLVKQSDGRYDVPRAQPSEDHETGINSAMRNLGIDVREKVLFTVVEGRHQQRLSIYYRCRTAERATPENAEYFDLDALPLDNLSRPYLAEVLQRYTNEKQAGKFGIFVGVEHQGNLEDIAEREI